MRVRSLGTVKERMEFCRTIFGSSGGSGDPVIDHEADFVVEVEVVWTERALASGDPTNISLRAMRVRVDCRDSQWEPFDGSRLDNDSGMEDELRDEAFSKLFDRERPERDDELPWHKQ